MDRICIVFMVFKEQCDIYCTIGFPQWPWEGQAHTREHFEVQKTKWWARIQDQNFHLWAILWFESAFCGLRLANFMVSPKGHSFVSSCAPWIFTELQAPFSLLGGAERNVKESHSSVLGWGRLAVWVWISTCSYLGRVVQTLSNTMCWDGDLYICCCWVDHATWCGRDSPSSLILVSH